MAMMLDLTGFEQTEAARLRSENLKQMVLLAWAATAARLGELVVATRLESDGLERMVKLTAAARLCELALAVILNLSGLEQEAARPRSDGFERAAAGLRGLCKLAAKLNLDDLEERAAAGLCELYWYLTMVEIYSKAK